jgi:L-ascorbate metabolism protein UlaG (beta-lactamase superfamily)
MLIEIYILCVLFIILLINIAIFRFHRPFGGRLSAQRKNDFIKSPHYVNGKFVNLIPTSMSLSFRKIVSVLWSIFVGGRNRKPNQPLPFEKLNLVEFSQAGGVNVSWLGHSAIMLTMNEKIIMIDPMLGRGPSPFPWLSGKRYSRDIPIDLDQLPDIDAVFFSHDHYDHLDYDSIQSIHPRVNHFFVPLGVGEHLMRWGVPSHKIREFDWWDELPWGGLLIACTPARHFSGRKLLDRDHTLWCSWVIGNETTKIFLSGDSGYGPHFAEIGRRYGPFDLGFLECGQYDERWRSIHLMPEETVQACLDIRAKTFIPIHWAAFTLSFHDWFDPAERVVQAAKLNNIPIITPKMGERVSVGESSFASVYWWRQIL